jgi:preprotein translocase subunit SecF
MLTISVVALITGISSMLSFSLPMLFALIFGFMTSLYVVGPLWATWNNRKNNKA